MLDTSPYSSVYRQNKPHKEIAVLNRKMQIIDHFGKKNASNVPRYTQKMMAIAMMTSLKAPRFTGCSDLKLMMGKKPRLTMIAKNTIHISKKYRYFIVFCSYIMDATSDLDKFCVSLIVTV